MARYDPATDRANTGTCAQQVIGLTVGIKHLTITAGDQDSRSITLHRIGRRRLSNCRINQAVTNLKGALQMRQELREKPLILFGVGSAVLRPMNSYRGDGVVTDWKNRPDHVKNVDLSTEVLIDLGIPEIVVG